MSLLSSLYIGTSGLAANSTELAVVGDNIANANTIGFKASRAAFQDALSQSLIGGAGQMGLGTRLQAVQKMLTQGSFLSTGVSTDLAISGAGFFMVNGSHDGREGTYYTRAGQFTLNNSGYLVNLEGLRVQGFRADAAGNVGGTATDLLVGDATSTPAPTANITVRANLQADAVLPPAWDPLQPATTSNFTTSSTVYDSLGQAHEVNLHYRRTGAGTWEWFGLADGAGQEGGTAGVPVEVASGTLTFDTEGRLVDQTQTSNFNPVNAVQPQALNFDLGASITAGGTGLEGITQFAGPSATTFLNADGFSAGTLANIQVDASGNVVGAFTNGATRVLGQVAIADFAAPDQLQRIGGNLYTNMSSLTGPPVIGAPSEGGRGSVAAGALEQSNVDLASEFVRMIAAQRGFQANSKTISTADQLLSELIALKR